VKALASDYVAFIIALMLVIQFLTIVVLIVKLP
jgi:hypothetical protein